MTDSCIFLIKLAVLGLLGGCATAQRPDPLEPLNRKVFAFNEEVDTLALRPLATAYEKVVPNLAREGVTNFFSNLADPWSAVNLLLQGRLQEGFSDVARFGTNTVVGVLGFHDVASGWGLSRHGKDFGQTLGAWGLEPGAYLVLPLLGPSSVRDIVALPLDTVGKGQTLVPIGPLRYGMGALQLVNRRASLLKAGQLIDDIAFDKYSFLRDAYLQYRRRQINDMNPSSESSLQDSENPPEAQSLDAASESL